MNSQNYKKILFFLIIFFSLIQINFANQDTLEIFSPKYFNEQKNIYEQIHYLENEELSFEFCSKDSKNISFTIMCNNIPKKLEIIENKNKNGCYFSNFDLNTLTCSQFQLQIDYNVNNKIRQLTRDFKKQKQSLLINHVISKKYETLNPEDLSYYLIVLNEIQDKTSKENEEVYEKLKNERDNDNKCWPKNNCDIQTTATILQNLRFAGYDLKSRLLEDGKIYLERNLISNDNNPLKFEIGIEHDFDTNQEISCELTIDNEEKRTYIFDEDSNNDSEIIKEASENIYLLCNSTIEEINFKLYNIDDNININKIYENTNSFNHKIEPFACVGRDDCNYYASINTLSTYKNSIKDSSLIENYINSLIIEFDREKFVNFKNKIIDTSMYLHYKKNDDLVKYLTFSQNNEGSWGSSTNNNKIIPTSWSVIGLQNINPTSEYVNDAKKWIYFNEPILGWETIEKNSLAYLAIKENLKPYLKINSKNYLEDLTKFEIENPTIYELKDVKIIFSENINTYLSYTQNLGELKGEEKIEFEVKVNENLFGEKSGEMIISGVDGKNNEIQLIKSPINIKGEDLFTIFQQNIVLFDDETIMTLEIDSSVNNYDFECSYKNPFTDIDEKTSLIYPLNEIKINNPNQETGNNYTIEFICIDKNKEEFKTPIEINIIKTNKTFEIIDTNKIIKSTSDFSISVQNINDDRQVLEFEIEGDLKDIVIPSEKNKVLAKNETREIYFTVIEPELLNIYNSSNSKIIVKSEEGYQKKIPLIVSLQEEEKQNNLLLYSIISFIAILAIIFLIIRYRQLQNTQEITNENNTNDELILDDLEFEE